MSVTQTDFRQAILDSRRPVPDGLIDPEGRPAGKRFDVYRNNVAVGLTEALRVAFPVIRQLLGDENFDGLSGIFLRRYPPSSPLLMFYGAEFPDFLAGMEQLAHLGYLPDVAQIEQAIRHSYHAADIAPIGPEELQNLPPEALMQCRMVLSPAVQLIRSPWPAHAIWQAHQPDGGPKPEMRAEDVLIARPDYDPIVTCLPTAGGAFVAALQAGATFGAALEQAQAENENFDLSTTLAHLLSGQAITQINPEETP